MSKSKLFTRLIIYVALFFAVAAIYYHKYSVQPADPQKGPEQSASYYAYTDYPYPFREAVTKQYYLLALRYFSDQDPPAGLFGDRESLAVQRLKSSQIKERNAIVMVYKDRTVSEITPAENGYFDIIDDLQKAARGAGNLVNFPSAESLSVGAAAGGKGDARYNPVDLITDLNAVDKRLLASFNMEDLLKLARLSALMGHHLERTYSQPAWFYGTAVAAADMAYHIWKKPECLETLAFSLAMAGRQTDAGTILEKEGGNAENETIWKKYASAMITYNDKILSEETGFLGRYLQAELLAHDYKGKWAVEKYLELLQDDPFFWLSYEKISDMGTIADLHRSTVGSYLALLANPDVWRLFNIKEIPAANGLEALFNAFSGLKIEIDEANGKDERMLVSYATSYSILSSLLEKAVAERLYFLGWSFNDLEETRDFLAQTQPFLNRSEVGDFIGVIGREPLGERIGKAELVSENDSILTTKSRLDIAYYILSTQNRDDALSFIMKRRNRVDDTSEDGIWKSNKAWSIRKYWHESIKEAKRVLLLSPYDHRAYYNLKCTEYTQPWDRRGLEKLPDSYAMHVNSGDYYFRSVVPRYKQAEPLFKKAISLYPHNFSPYEKLAGIYRHYGEYDKVKSVLESYLEHGPKGLNAVSAQCDLAEINMEQGILKKAYVLYKDASESWMNRALLGFAHINERMGNLDAAEKYYSRARDRYRDAATDDYGFFQLRHDLKGGKVLLENLIRNLKDEYSRNPGDYDILSQIGGIYTILGDLDNGRDYFEKALGNGEKSTFVKLMLGVIAYEKGDIEEARNIFTRTVSTHPFQDEYKALLPVLKGQKNADEFLLSVPHNSAGTGMHFILHYYYLMQDDHQKARECLEKTVRSAYPRLWSWNLAYRKLKRTGAISTEFWSAQKLTAGYLTGGRDS